LSAGSGDFPVARFSPTLNHSRPKGTTTKTSDTPVTGCLFSVSHETDVEHAAFRLHGTVAAKQIRENSRGVKRDKIENDYGDDGES
jgi:hypothetical protein